MFSRALPRSMSRPFVRFRTVSTVQYSAVQYSTVDVIHTREEPWWWWWSGTCLYVYMYVWYVWYVCMCSIACVVCVHVLCMYFLLLTWAWSVNYLGPANSIQIPRSCGFEYQRRTPGPARGRYRLYLTVLTHLTIYISVFRR